MKKVENRVLYLDILRVIAIIGVITIHVTGVNVIHIENIHTAKWWISNVFNSLSRFCIPVFFMISGALILSSPMEGDILGGIKRRIKKIGIPFLVWSVLYNLFKHIVLVKDHLNPFELTRVILFDIMTDRTYSHLWFIYVIAGIYMVSPFIKKLLIGTSEKEVRYLVLLWFIATICYSTAQSIFNFINHGKYLYIAFFKIPMASGHVGYFILGYYIHRFGIKKRIRAGLYVLGLISIISIPLLTYAITVGKQGLNESFYSPFALTNALSAAAIFLLFKNSDWSSVNPKSKKFICSASNATMGIYFIHLIIQQWVESNIHIGQSISTFTMTVVNVFFTFMFSFVVVKICNLNTKLGKYLGT